MRAMLTSTRQVMTLAGSASWGHADGVGTMANFRFPRGIALAPDQQTLLFSATFKRPIELLARDICVNPIKITSTFGSCQPKKRNIPVIWEVTI